LAIKKGLLRKSSAHSWPSGHLDSLREPLSSRNLARWPFSQDGDRWPDGPDDHGKMGARWARGTQLKDDKRGSINNLINLRSIQRQFGGTLAQNFPKQIYLKGFSRCWPSSLDLQKLLPRALPRSCRRALPLSCPVIWSHLEASGVIWSHLEPSAVIWIFSDFLSFSN